MGTETIEVGMCAGRDGMAVKYFMWQKNDDQMDYQGLENHAKDWLKSEDLSDQPTVRVYVTGLTVALTSFLSAWEQIVGTMDFERMRRPYLWLFHYDRNTDTYRE